MVEKEHANKHEGVIVTFDVHDLSELRFSRSISRISQHWRSRRSMSNARAFSRGLPMIPISVKLSILMHCTSSPRGW